VSNSNSFKTLNHAYLGRWREVPGRHRRGLEQFVALALELFEEDPRGHVPATGEEVQSWGRLILNPLFHINVCLELNITDLRNASAS
jgi:hypothetical protein